MSVADDLTRFRAVLAGMTPKPWMDGPGPYEGRIIANLPDTIVDVAQDPEGDDRPGDRAGIVLLRNTASALADVVEAASNLVPLETDPPVRQRNARALEKALAAFSAAMEEGQ